MPDLTKGPFEGHVAEREDPLELHRVRAIIPGVIDGKTSWLIPIGAANGPGKGEANTPDLHAEVYVVFLAGNPDNGRYWPGHWGKGEVPSGAVTAASGDHKIYDDGVIRVERDERASTKGIRIKHADGTTLIEYDANTRRVRLYQPTSLDLKVDGELKIEAPVITINDRPVLPTGDPI